MSNLRGITGVVQEGVSVTGIAPALVGGKDCTGLLQAVPVCSSTPSSDVEAVFVAARPTDIFRDSFSDVIASGVNANWSLICTGSGQTISQSAGNLVMTSGTGTNTETIIRSTKTWSDSMVLRFLTTVSQYNANALSFIELVDVIGDDLAVTSSTTAVTVTKANHGFTSLNIGQSLFIGAFKNLVGGGVIVPGQWAIASITNVNQFVLTATGSTGTVTSGTCSVWGYNSIRVRYPATSTTTAYFNTTRRGWNSAADTSATVSTITSGSYGIISFRNGVVGFSESTANSTSALTARAARVLGNPGTENLYLQLRILNGTVAPSATTFTIGAVAVEDVAAMPVDFPLQSSTGNGLFSLPTVVSNTVTISGTGIGVVGAAAHDAAVSGNPNRIGGRALTANYTAVATGDTADLVTTLTGSLVTRDFSIPELEFGIADTITNSTTAVQVKAATASNHNYVTSMEIQTATLGGASIFQLRSTPVASPSATIASNTLVMSGTYNWKVGDLIYVTASTVTGLTAGNYYYLLTVSTTSLTFSTTRVGSTLTISGTSVTATIAKVLFRTTLATTALPLSVIRFGNPLSGGTGLAIEAVTLTAVTGAVDINVQGYVAP